MTDRRCVVALALDRGEKGTKKVTTSARINFAAPFAEVKACLEASLRKSPQDPFVVLAQIKYRVDNDDDRWVAPSAGGRAGGRACKKGFG